MARLGRSQPFKPLTLARRLFNNVIEFDASSGDNAVANSISFSHTCTGNNLLMLAFVEITNGDLSTGVTYGGVAMTLVNKGNRGDGRFGYTYILTNPASGSNTASATSSAGGQVYLTVISYRNCAQSGQPDSSNSATPSTASTPYTLNTTVVATGSWIVGIYDNSAGSVTAISGTKRTPAINPAVPTFYDSNNPVAPGAQGLSYTFTGTFTSYVSIVSIKPFGSAITTGAAFLLRMISPF